MARPRGTGKSTEEKFITKTLKWPPDLWSEVEAHIPERERSEFIRQAVKDAVFRRSAERLRDYYATDPEVVEWADFVGEAPDE
jgi:hypothetical protein